MNPPGSAVVVWKTMIASTASARTPSSAGRYVMPAERGLASVRGEGLNHVVHDLERDLAGRSRAPCNPDSVGSYPTRWTLARLAAPGAKAHTGVLGPGDDRRRDP